MSEKLLIDEAGIVTIIREQIVATTTIDRLMETKNRGQPMTTPILPKGVVKFETVPSYNMYYVVEEPEVGMCTYQYKLEAYNRDDRRVYANIPVLYPYRIHIFVVNTGTGKLDSRMYRYGFCGVDPRTFEGSWDDLPVHRPWVPNQYRDGRVCGGDEYQVLAADTSKSINQRIEDSKKYMSTCTYNDHLPEFRSWLPNPLKATLPEEHINMFDAGEAWSVATSENILAFRTLTENSRALIEAEGVEAALLRVTEFCSESVASNANKRIPMSELTSSFRQRI